MTSDNRKKIIRLLGVGFDAHDDHVRITSGEKFDVVMGSEESHEYMLELIQKIEQAIEERGCSLSELTPEEFTRLVDSLI